MVIEATVWGVVFGIVAVFAAGLRRLPWLYAGLVGLGAGIVLGALRLATLDSGMDPGLLVLLGALGGSVATLGSERGERERARRSAAILAGRPLSRG